MENLMKIYDEENRKLWFGISKVDRYQEGEEDDPWWNIHVVYKRHWIDYDEKQESMTEFELKALADEIEKRFIKGINKTKESLYFIEPDYAFEFEEGFEHGTFIINIGFADSIHIYLEKEDLIKIYNCICDKLNYKK